MMDLMQLVVAGPAGTEFLQSAICSYPSKTTSRPWAMTCWLQPGNLFAKSGLDCCFLNQPKHGIILLHSNSFRVLYINFQCIFYNARLKKKSLKSLFCFHFSCHNFVRHLILNNLLEQDLDQKMIEKFLQEGIAMKNFNHPHVLSLIGLCLGYKKEPMVILPFMANGDLRTYVKDQSKVTIKSIKKLLIAPKRQFMIKTFLKSSSVLFYRSQMGAKILFQLFLNTHWTMLQSISRKWLPTSVMHRRLEKIGCCFLLFFVFNFLLLSGAF